MTPKIPFRGASRLLRGKLNLLRPRCNLDGAAFMSSLPPDSPMNVFDRNAKLLQRERAARDADVQLYDYIKDEVGDRLADRIFDIKRKFGRALDLGCGRGHVSKRILSESVEELVLADMSPGLLRQAETTEGVKVSREVVDEESPAFEPDSFDMVISCLSLHWVNDLPGCLRRVNGSLKKDGVFLAAVFGGDTLYELRSSLQLAEFERHGGISPHISPFVEIRDIGSLLTRANFTMLTIDTDEIVIGYPSMFELMWDLKGMAESNAARNRNLHLPRDTLVAAAAIYKQLYGKTKEDGTAYVPATFQIIYMLGWKPDASQPKPLERGTGQVSLKDLYRLDQIIKNSKKIKLDEDK
ncbi:PREDICTED: NADH dehydrogenase [ubiquinone] 1 alpha subcomplex assembly factor 5 [Vollenhovia emeryi]|uniref:NADH dehydrogenase [ubiquinone] 1 alpha subcomplex assembly factor 5 n=1 Tax=Vollenhovia emeryi TaxID=411798 RepID=UPI0005F52F48|nr:PREDICTED: NADH dehydrogenase [ubiquinone] 1 alpha subcomplex assembly factor 5 [Vollenhovia emeryi]XP_011880493.1 PREDICTED: NADH dehydrogenase [ubiquinone] 1 alpha subcomplex assembly factor 5 [Vollenhovia emeryi]